jgi:hypothetical protein
MAERETSPQVYARVGGVLYLIIIGIGFSGEAFIRGRLTVPGDATATAERIRAAEFLWRFGIAAELLLLVCAVGLALVFYVLLKPVSRNLALLATFFNVVSITIEAVAAQRLDEAFFPLANATYLKGLDPRQLHALSYLSIRSFEHGFGVSLIFFGCACIIVGYLIFRSGYLPRAVGVLMEIAGASYLVNSFALILSPPLAHRLFPAILLPALIGEASLCLTLLARGVNAERWNASARAHDRALSPL